MTIYLYVKTHNKTGLKYLGKTISTDPHKYTGSGTRWLKHIKKHGYDVTTEIIKVCETAEEVRTWGLHYSKLWNIVESREWANLKDECGDGGACPGPLNGMYGKTHTEEARQKIRENKRSLKGMTYTTIYGEDRAKELKLERSMKLKKYFKIHPESRIGSRNGNSKKYKLISPDNVEYVIEGTLKVFCKDHSLDPGEVINLVKGRKRSGTYKGWTGSYI